jgi:hypothetical protein
MNTRRDPETILAAWLDEGPPVLPDATRRAILTALPTTSQARRGLLTPWRFSRMNTYTRLAAVALVAAIAVGGAFYLLRGGAVGSPGPTPTSPIAPTPSPREAATAPPVALYGCEIRTVTWDGSSAVDLTGTWAANDGGVYYLRQLDDEIWWLGMSGRGQPLVDRGVRWTNVFHGTLSGDTITGTYADVPQGRILDKGPVVMKLTPTADGGISLVNANPILPTGFGGYRFTPCTLG